jgi:serine/threonine-protein kinase
LLDRPVAVKVLFPEFATDPSFVARFRREAQAAANLSHPNIVSVYDWGEQSGTYFIVMEYVEGRSLADVIRSEGPLHPQRAAEIATDIAAALGFAHRNGVVHRDVKPGNVLLSPSGQVKVADFGIARAMGAGAEENLTQTGAVMGTATYFSPEQAQGLPLDPRSDLYALGIVLYEMVAGRPPFQGDSPVAIAYKHVQEPPVSPRRINPDVPAPLEAIILTLLAKDPAHRYASAEELRADLRRFVEGHPVAAAAMAADATAAIRRPVQPPVDATQAVHTQHTGPRTTASPRVQPTYEPPRRTGAFLVVLVLLLLILAGLLFALAKVLGIGEADDTVPTVAVPLVVGDTAEVATQKLTDQGFTVKRIDETDPATPVGIVFRQEPDQGTELESGAEVTIHVSSGAPTVEMPRVVGMQEADARALLSGQGFTNITTQQRADEDIAEGEVIEQIPTEGSQVSVDAAITLVVSTGPADREVPNVEGLTVAEASNILGQAGFEVDQQSEPSDTVDEGTVIRTDPPKGSVQPKGTRVTIFVSSGPQLVSVPTVVGLSQEDATDMLEAAGFVVAVEEQAVEDEGQVGIVQTQSPGADEEAPEGSTVTITVGVLQAVN